MAITNNKINLVCLVDDDNIYTYSAKKILKESPVFENHIVFNNAIEAIEHFKKVADDVSQIPDVIFLDINMPVMDGWNFIEEFSKLESSIKKKVTIYMVSSSIDPHDIERAKSKSEIAQYIIKPINIDQFEKIFKFFDMEAA